MEEMIWSKAFIMERERYDGADIAHLLQASAERSTGRGCCERFGATLARAARHLVLFGFIYPGEPRPRAALGDGRADRAPER